MAKAPPVAPQKELTVTLSRKLVDELRRHAGTAVNALSMPHSDRDRLAKVALICRSELDAQKGDTIRLKNNLDGWIWLAGMCSTISAWDVGAALVPQVSKAMGD